MWLVITEFTVCRLSSDLIFLFLGGRLELLLIIATVFVRVMHLLVLLITVALYALLGATRWCARIKWFMHIALISLFI